MNEKSPVLGKKGKNDAENTRLLNTAAVLPTYKKGNRRNVEN